MAKAMLGELVTEVAQEMTCTQPTLTSRRAEGVGRHRRVQLGRARVEGALLLGRHQLPPAARAALAEVVLLDDAARLRRVRVLGLP